MIMLIAFSVGSLIAALLVGWLVGGQAAEDGTSFNWDSASVAATAIATALLGALTGMLAWTTARDQDRRDVVYLAVRSCQWLQTADGQVHCGVTIRNVGTAPAAYISLKVDRDDLSGVVLTGLSHNDNFLRSGEETTVAVAMTTIDERPEDLQGHVQTRVLGVCLDVASRPQHFIYQRFHSGGSSFLFKTRPWSMHSPPRTQSLATAGKHLA